MSEKIIDLYMDIPTGEDLYLTRLSMYCLGDGPHTRMGYRRLFRGGEAKAIGLDLDELDRIVAEQGEDAFTKVVQEHSKAYAWTEESFMKHIEELHVEWGFTGSHDRDNEKTAALVARYPDKLKGACYINPAKGMDAVRELEYYVKERNLSALYISPIRIGMPANDKRCYPLYAKAAELDIPVFIYANMNLISTLPMEIGHPRNIDEVASFFPELRIMITVGGWPWMNEAVGVVIRHDNVYLDTEIIPPKNLTEPGNGYEFLIYHIRNSFPDKFCFASNWAMNGLQLELAIQQIKDLPFDDGVIENILYNNAKRFFNET